MSATLVLLLALFISLAQGQLPANIPVPSGTKYDDQSAEWTYQICPHYTNLSPCTGCYIQPDVSKLFDKTYHDCSLNNAQATFQFEGTAVDVFGVCPGPVPIANSKDFQAFTGNVSFTLDNQSAGSYILPIGGCSEWTYNRLIISLDGLSNGMHTLTITSLAPKPPYGYLLIDYAVVNPVKASVPPSQPQPQSQPNSTSASSHSSSVSGPSSMSAPTSLGSSSAPLSSGQVTGTSSPDSSTTSSSQQGSGSPTSPTSSSPNDTPSPSQSTVLGQSGTGSSATKDTGSSQSSSGLSHQAIAGIVVPVVLAWIGFAIACVFAIQRRQQQLLTTADAQSTVPYTVQPSSTPTSEKSSRWLLSRGRFNGGVQLVQHSDAGRVDLPPHYDPEWDAADDTAVPSNSRRRSKTAGTSRI